MLADAVRASAHGVVASLGKGSSGRSRGDWLDVAADCQSLINTVTAVQDLALAEAARRECVWREDGTVGEAVHAPGRVTVDAADVAAPVLGASHAQAQLRMEQAVPSPRAECPWRRTGEHRRRTAGCTRSTPRWPLAVSTATAPVWSRTSWRALPRPSPKRS